MPGVGQRMTQSRNDQPPRQTGIAKPHLGFGGMHIHIHQRGVTVQKQRRCRVAVTTEEIEIGAAQGTGQKFVPHRAAIHEQVLRHRRAARIGRQRGKACQVQPLAFRINAQRVISKFAPQHPRQTTMQRIEQLALFGVGAKHLAPCAIA